MTIALPAIRHDGYFPLAVDLRALMPISALQMLLLPAAIWIFFRIVRHSRRALVWAYITAGLAALTGLATLALVELRIGGFEDYPLRFQELQEFIPLVLSALTLALLCTPGIRDWCDD